MNGTTAATETRGDESAALLERGAWSPQETSLAGPAWAQTVEQLDGGLHWERGVEVPTSLHLGITEGDPDNIRVYAAQTDELTSAPGAPVVVERSEVRIFLDDYSMTLPQARELARALNGLVERVERAPQTGSDGS